MTNRRAILANMRGVPDSNRMKPALSRIAAIAALIFLLGASIYPLPGIVLRLSNDDWHKLSLSVRVSQEAQVRGQLLQAVGALLLLAGAVTAFRQLMVAQGQARTERASRNVEAFTQAVTMLSGATAASRTAGVMALQSLAEAGGVKRRPALDILCSYVRDARAPEDRLACEFAVRAAVSLREPRDPLDFSGAQLLTNSNLSQLRLVDARFAGCDLRETDFSGSDLRGCAFDGADLSRSALYSADLSGVDLASAKADDLRLDSATKLPL